MWGLAKVASYPNVILSDYFKYIIRFFMGPKTCHIIQYLLYYCRFEICPNVSVN